MHKASSQNRYAYTILCFLKYLTTSTHFAILNSMTSGPRTDLLAPAPTPASAPPAPPSASLGDRARDDLRFIRHTMERGTAFTAVPGWGGVAMGLSAVGAAPLAAAQPTPQRWLMVWLGEAALAVAIGGWALRKKALRTELAVLSGAGRRFFLGFLPPAGAAAVLTLTRSGDGDLMFIAALWLLLYGAAVMTAGAFSVKVVPRMGMAFMALGVTALALDPIFGSGPKTASGFMLYDALLALGFGGLHIGFGLYIARKYGG